MSGFKDIIRAVAPVVGSVMGGPLGGAGLKFLADKLTGGDTNELETYINNASPDQLVELKNADLEFKKFCKDNDLKFYQADVESQGSARKMATAKGMTPQIVLSVLFVVAYVWTAYSLIDTMLEGRPLNLSQELLIMFGAIFGVMSSALTQILNFWFGSSRGSKDKSDAMTSVLSKLTN